MLRIILGIVLIAVITGLGNLLLNRMLRAPRKSKYGRAKARALYPIVGICCAILSIGIIYIMLTSHRNRLNFGVVPCLIITFVAGMVMIWQWVSERIWYDKTSFVVRDFWMVKRKYAYKDITGICHASEIYLILGETKVAVSSLLEGGERFVRTALKGYAEANNGEEVPRVSKAPRKAINGSIQASNDFAMVGALMLTLLGGMLIVINLHPSEITSEHFEASLVNVVDYVSEDEQGLTFYLQDLEDPFVIRDFPRYAQNTNLLRQADGKPTKFSVYAEYMTASRSRDAYYHVCSMSDENGNVYVTFDMTWAQEREWRRIINIGICGLLIVFIIWGAANVISARSPQRHKLLDWLFSLRKSKRW